MGGGRSAVALSVGFHTSGLLVQRRSGECCDDGRREECCVLWR
jgi:hypothetical protein